ncbi:MAG: hypothetical protein U9M98_00805 [Patescibacteria group bacterium]|nr:hypothetical protein [Patescibacteria group bacterium]
MSLKSKFLKSFNAFSLGLMVFFALLAVGILVSSTSLPGDTTYPLKISLENMAIFVSQIHSPTEMELRLIVLNRRYQEARELLEGEGSGRGYKYFSDAAAATQRAVLGVENDQLRAQYREALAEDLRRYNAELEYLIQQLETP